MENGVISQFPKKRKITKKTEFEDLNEINIKHVTPITGCETGTSIKKPDEPQIKFEFTNPTKPSTRATILRCSDGTIRYQNFVPCFRLQKSPLISHEEFLRDLEQKLGKVLILLHKSETDINKDLVITVLDRALLWSNDKCD